MLKGSVATGMHCIGLFYFCGFHSIDLLAIIQRAWIERYFDHFYTRGSIEWRLFQLFLKVFLAQQIFKN